MRIGRRQIMLEQAASIDYQLRRMQEMDNLQHPFDRHKPRPRPMTKAEFRAAVMRDLGIEENTQR